MVPKKLPGKLRLLQVLLLVILFSTNTVIGQEDKSQDSSEDIIASAYKDVWEPFMESYRALDIEKFKSIQASDLIKVAIDRNTIQTKATYFESIEGFFNQIKQMNRQMDIRFSILSSATGDSKIYQTGYYSIGMRASNSESFQPTGYGYFVVVLIKEDGSWKISMDADKQATINEEEFNKSDVIYQLD
ncbi:MAG: nuclear transport factor 2 family protein [Eudoraea sp.]|nr:nuclear transport factor 2 family protein [Eudoraea sp.]